jgi:hypothetical protein
MDYFWIPSILLHMKCPPPVIPIADKAIRLLEALAQLRAELRARVRQFRRRGSCHAIRSYDPQVHSRSGPPQWIESHLSPAITVLDPHDDFTPAKPGQYPEPLRGAARRCNQPLQCLTVEAQL